MDLETTSSIGAWDAILQIQCPQCGTASNQHALSNLMCCEARHEDGIVKW